MSIVPAHRPVLDHDVARQTCYQRLLADAYCDAYGIISKCPVMMLAIRDPIPGRYNDTMALILGPTAPVLLFNGNTDPGKYGKNPQNGKFYARLRTGVWFFIKGHHNGEPKKFREPDPAQARDAGLPELFHDPDRAKGHVTVDRMETAEKFEPDTGNFNINLHNGGDHTTSSAGCQTLPQPQYDEMRDAAYEGMARSGQSFLPYILINGPLVV